MQYCKYIVAPSSKANVQEYSLALPLSFVPFSFWAVGYAFAYGGDDSTKGKTFIGNANFFLTGDDIEYHNWFFQFAFACALSSIVAGTIAERTQMVRLLFVSFLVPFFL